MSFVIVSVKMGLPHKELHKVSIRIIEKGLIEGFKGGVHVLEAVSCYCTLAVLASDKGEETTI